MPEPKTRRIPKPIWFAVAAVLMVVLSVCVWVWLPYHLEQVVIREFVRMWVDHQQIRKVDTDHGENPSDISTDEIYLEYGDGHRKYLTHNNLMERVPAFSPDNQFVSFLRRRDTNSDGKVDWDDDCELCLFDLRTSTTKLLSDDLSDVGMPTWHPNALRIAFMAGKEGSKKLYILDLLTGKRTDVKSVRDADSWPAWSPDGSLIAFYDEQNRVNVVKPDGTQRRILSDDVGNGWALYWTFDNRLIFTHTKRGWQVYSPINQRSIQISSFNSDRTLDQQIFGWSQSIDDRSGGQ